MLTCLHRYLDTAGARLRYSQVIHICQSTVDSGRHTEGREDA
jgi:hypothetical protein